ncbi:MAG: hypothetical protein Q9216_005546 [Gyalolechia sp. 2 TL-2023]
MHGYARSLALRASRTRSRMFEGQETARRHQRVNYTQLMRYNDKQDIPDPKRDTELRLTLVARLERRFYSSLNDAISTEKGVYHATVHICPKYMAEESVCTQRYVIPGCQQSIPEKIKTSGTCVRARKPSLRKAQASCMPIWHDMMRIREVLYRRRGTHCSRRGLRFGNGVLQMVLFIMGSVCSQRDAATGRDRCSMATFLGLCFTARNVYRLHSSKLRCIQQAGTSTTEWVLLWILLSKIIHYLQSAALPICIIWRWP